MALGATLYRFTITLQHVDRGIYETLDLRAAAHPSETTASVITRVLAHCFFQEEGMAFSRGGLSDPDEPALSVHTLDGRMTLWVDIGVPSAERLHKASKACARVAVVTHKRPGLLLESVASGTIHRREHLELYALDEELLAQLDAVVKKHNTWEVTFTDGALYVTVDGTSHSGTLQPLTV
jgi:uncharacterized protein YaeQ